MEEEREEEAERRRHVCFERKWVGKSFEFVGKVGTFFCGKVRISGLVGF